MQDTFPQAAPGALRVLGIDPGLADVGYGVIDCGPAPLGSKLVTYGVIQTHKGVDLTARLDEIYRKLGAIVSATAPAIVCVEQLFFAKNIKTAMVVAHGRAACLLATAHSGAQFVEYTPLQIKQALTGHGRAGKLQVQMMVRAVLGLAEIPQPDHAADALAAALCHVHSLGRRSMIARALESAAPAADAALDPRKLLLAQRRGATRRRR